MTVLYFFFFSIIFSSQSFLFESSRSFFKLVRQFCGQRCENIPAVLTSPCWHLARVFRVCRLYKVCRKFLFFLFPKVSKKITDHKLSKLKLSKIVDTSAANSDLCTGDISPQCCKRLTWHRTWHRARQFQHPILTWDGKTGQVLCRCFLISLLLYRHRLKLILPSSSTTGQGMTWIHHHLACRQTFFQELMKSW